MTLPITIGGGTVDTSGLASKLGFGTAAVKDVGTAPGNVVQVDESGALPALDGSKLLNLPNSGGSSYTLPPASSSTLGGIKTGTPGTGQFVSGFSADGTAQYATPASSGGDLSSTDALPEGATNQYFTQSRARNAISVAGSLTYSPTTGVISYTAPVLATVATSGSYADLSNKPAIPTTTDGLSEGTSNLYFSQSRARSAISATGSLAYNATTGVISYTAPALAAVATSGSYADLSNKPTIPTNTNQLTNGAGFVDQAGARNALSVSGSLGYNATTGVISYTAPTLAAVATSGSYADLLNKPAFAAIATSGSATDLTTGTLPDARLATTGVTAGAYGSSSQIPVITFDDKGRATAVTTVANAGGGSGGGTGTVTPSGSFAVNDVILANTNDGNSIKSGGQPGSFVRALLSGTAGIVFNSSTGAFSLAAPTTTILGGVLSATAGANQFQTGIATSGAPTFAQPSFGNLSGAAIAAQLPAFTGGDVTAAAGSTVLVLGTTGVTAQAYGLHSVTFDAKGRATAAANIALTGDVTTATGGTATTIGGNVVGNTKLAQMAAGTIKGNATGATANAADSSLSAYLDLLSSTQGAVLYRGASSWAALGPGTSGQLLQTGGASANPSWATPAAGNVSTSGTPTNGQLAAFTGASTIQGVTTLPAANFPALTGDLANTAGSLATTLATTGVTAQAYSAIASFTVDAKGRLTAAANQALTGDVTTVAGSLATTIVASAVTNAKLATMAASTFKGRVTASTGNPEDLTAAQATGLLIAFAGDSGSGGTKGLVPAPASGDAAAGKVLGASGSWVTQAAASGGSAAPSATRAISAADTIVASDKSRVLQLTGTFTLGATAAATLGAGFYCFLKKTDGGGKVTFDPNGAETIDGRTSIGVYQEAFLIWTDGSSWFSQGRIEGWVSVSRVTLTGQTLASLSITDGFGDLEAAEVEVNYSNLVCSTSTSVSLRPMKGGAVIGAPSYVIEASSTTTTSNTAPVSQSANTSVSGTALVLVATTASQWGVLNARNTISSNPTDQRVDWEARQSGATRRGTIFDTTTAAAVSGINLLPASGTISSISYTVKVFRQ